MTRKQAFSQLIQQRNWYKNMNIKQNTAATHKKRFLQGKNVSDDFMKRALEAAGYSCIYPEEWELIENIKMISRFMENERLHNSPKYIEKKISFNDLTTDELQKANEMGCNGWFIVSIDIEMRPDITIYILTYRKKL